MLFWNRNTDQISGVNVALNGKKAIKNLTIEWVNTTHQSGSGTPDPIVVYPNGSIEFVPVPELRLRDLDALMANLGQTQSHPYTIEEVVDYLREEFNNGQPYGGRDGYLSNGVYPAGWTNYGAIMGSPLNLIRNQIAQSSPNLGIYSQNNVINDRIKAIHIGGFGYITELLKWKGMFTYSVNYGSYYNQYPGRNTWTETGNYYFKGGLKQFYSLIGVDWQPQKNSKFEFGGNISLDMGDIFNSFGMKLSTCWKI
jgi:hypothetical protein